MVGTDHAPERIHQPRRADHGIKRHQDHREGHHERADDHQKHRVAATKAVFRQGKGGHGIGEQRQQRGDGGDKDRIPQVAQKVEGQERVGIVRGGDADMAHGRAVGDGDVEAFGGVGRVDHLRIGADAAHLGHDAGAAIVQRDGEQGQGLGVALDRDHLLHIGQEGRGELGQLRGALERRGNQPQRRAEHQHGAADQPDPGDDIGPVPASAMAPAAGEEGQDAAHLSRALSARFDRPSCTSVSTTSTAPIRIEAAAASPGLRRIEAKPTS